MFFCFFKKSSSSKSTGETVKDGKRNRTCVCLRDCLQPGKLISTCLHIFKSHMTQEWNTTLVKVLFFLLPLWNVMYLCSIESHSLSLIHCSNGFAIYFDLICRWFNIQEWLLMKRPDGSNHSVMNKQRCHPEICSHTPWCVLVQDTWSHSRIHTECLVHNPDSGKVSYQRQPAGWTLSLSFMREILLPCSSISWLHNNFNQIHWSVCE